MVGVNTLCPFFSRRSDTRRRQPPPCQAPCTSTKVLPVVCACAVVSSIMLNNPALAARTPNTMRRVCPVSFVIVSSMLTILATARR